ncbi:MAG: 50S ribosome-binding GTPase [Candidatus Thermoplasmatota archaeon]|nr:50S ribosome-binding GTPase [Candidatus Thermoplasmatota archaeon]
MKEIRIALAGNPNVGKTSIFNVVTGLNQHVGNWPGKTVEKIEGERRHRNTNLKIVDLPGTYSLSAYSIDEIIARDHIIEEKPDVVVNIVDATNLERNLFLTTQLLELESRLILVLNMSDIATSRRIQIDTKKLSNMLGIPVLKTVASKKEGITELLDEIVTLADKKQIKGKHIAYDAEFEEKISKTEWDKLVDSSKKYQEIPIFPKDLKEISGANPDENELDALRIAMDSEKDAIDYYTEIWENSNDDEVKKIIDEIIEQEKNHYFLLEQEFNHLSSTGYWYELDYLGG